MQKLRVNWGAALALGLAVCFEANAQQAKFETLVSRPQGAVPRIAVLQNKLIVADNFTKELQIIDLKTKNRIFHQSIDGLPVALETDGKTWVGFCDHIGARLSLFQIDRPEKMHIVSLLPPETATEEPRGIADPVEVERVDGPSTHLYDINCGDFAFQAGKKHPRLWMGSPGSQEVVLLDPFKKKILKTKRVSGSFELVKVGINIFTLNETAIMSDAAIPYIYDSETGKSLVGDPLGDEIDTKLSRGYAPFVFNDEISDSVVFGRPREKVLHFFDARNPNEATMKEVAISVGRLRSVSRYKSCLVVAGQGENDQRRFQWSLLKQNASGFEEFYQTEEISEEGAGGLRYQVISDAGDLIVADWYGVHKITGAFDRNLCQ